MKRSALVFVLFLLPMLALATPLRVSAATWQTQDTWSLYAVTNSTTSASWQSQENWTLTLLPYNSASGTNLTLTTVTGSAWVTGGFDFKKAYTYATSTGFKPLHNVHAITITAWFRPRVVTTGTRYLASQYVSTNNLVALAQSTNQMKFTVSSGTSMATANSTAMTAGLLYYFVATWDKGLDGGKVNLYMNGTLFQSTRTITTNSSANDKFYISTLDGTANQLNGTLYGLAIYTYKFDAAMVNETRTNRDVIRSDASVYWNLNEGTGAVFYAEGVTWRHQDTFALVDPTAVPYEPLWQIQENWTLYVPCANASTTLIPDDPASMRFLVRSYMALAGFGLVIGGPTFFALRTKSDPSTFAENLVVSAMAILLGLALVVGLSI